MILKTPWKKIIKIIFYFAITILSCSNPANLTSSEIGNPEIEAGLYGHLVDGTTSKAAKGAIVRIYSQNLTVLAKMLGKNAVGASTPSDSAVTDSAGLYLFTNLDTGTYSILAQYNKGQDTLYAMRSGIFFVTKKLNVGVDTLKLPGSIQGRISISDSNKSGIFCYIPGTSFISISDSIGNYHVTNVPPGIYSISFMNGKYNDTTIPNVIVLPDSVTQVPVVALQLNPNQNERDIWGVFNENYNNIGKIDAIVTGDGISSNRPLIYQLSWRPDVKGFSGFVYVPKNGFFWNATVRVYDTKGHLTGESAISFDRNSGDLLVPTFNPLNAVPSVFAGNDTVVSINDTICIHPTAIDSFGGKIISWEWSIGDSGKFVSTLTPDTFVIAPSVPENLQFKFRVMDNDSNVVVASFNVAVILDAPIISLSPDTAVSAGATVLFKCGVSQNFGSIVMYKWGFDKKNSWEDSGAAKFELSHQFDSAGTYQVRAYERDDDGNVSMDTCTVVVGAVVTPNITSDQTWTANENPVVVNQNITIASNATLTIGPGVKVYMAQGKSITVNGGFVTNGTKDSLIVFQGVGNGTWGSIMFNAGPGTRAVQYCKFSNGGSSGALGTIMISSMSPRINSSVISNSGSSGIYIGGGGLYLDSSTIEKCSGYGIISNMNGQAGDIQVFNTSIEHNGNSGIVADIENQHLVVKTSVIRANNGTGIGIKNGSAEITGNTIDSNSNGSGSLGPNNGYYAGGGISLDCGGGGDTYLISGNTIQANNGYQGGAIFDWWTPGAEITNNVILGNNASIGGALYLTNVSGIVVSGNRIEKNNALQYVVDYMTLSLNTISNNTFLNNTVHTAPFATICIDTFFLTTQASLTPVLHNNNFVDPGITYEIFNSKNPMDATNNWWGSTDSVEIQKRIYDYSVDGTRGTVNFVPFLTSPSSLAPEIK
jgi:hypothetical protein